MVSKKNGVQEPLEDKARIGVWAFGLLLTDKGTSITSVMKR